MNDMGFLELKNATLLQAELRVFNSFSIIFNGISSSFDIIPKLEKIVLRLLTSVWLIAPTNGAEIM